ncbi:Ethylene-responsive transcription factor-like protein [Melia azedarach]|uniref:Ethylene-responsive transcription factor-like protein n=1 Tax=Melia azedarach TaxID=155640 RepID=A0ACC1YXQ8_MELAZ|nr:Ethylene-responsive transcription factor-like protein [Melia azedarach]
MVSLRRRKLLGLCSGKSSFVAPLPRNSENGNAPESSTQNVRPVGLHLSALDNVSRPQGMAVAKVEPASLNVSGASSPEGQNNQPKEQHFQSFSGLPIKRRKRHRRKQIQNQEPCLMRGVYFKNMKWQAAIKVDKKQIHLGTVGSQEEAARLYDRAAFMCGREPNFELSEEEKQELRQFKWEEFLAFTRRSITHKKYKRRLGAGSHKRSESPLEENGDGDWDSKQGVTVSGFSASEEVEPDSSAS